ncbi:Tetratricopeptide repeat protein 28, partial [Stylophora pistillata]
MSTVFLLKTLVILVREREEKHRCSRSQLLWKRKKEKYRVLVPLVNLAKREVPPPLNIDVDYGCLLLFLLAIAEVYLKDGDNEYSKGEAYNAVHFYTEGLQVNCKDIQVNAALYSNRAAAQLLLGNYQEALDDATLSVQLEPTFIKPIENGNYQEALDDATVSVQFEPTFIKAIENASILGKTTYKGYTTPTLSPSTRKRETSGVRSSKNLPKHIADSVRQKGSRLAHLYGLTKTHKKRLAVRPILSAVNTYNFTLAKWLDEKLKPLSVNRYTITDIFQFADEIKKMRFSECDILISYDVSSLFTNVPLEETINILANKAFTENWFNVTYNMNISRDDLVALLTAATKHQLFQFNGRLCEQIDGVAMRSPLGPLMANIFICSIEEKLEREKKLPYFYRGYVDDTLAVVQDISTASAFLAMLNKAHPALNFTMEVAISGKLPFIRIEVMEMGSQVRACLYRKTTDRGASACEQLHFYQEAIGWCQKGLAMDHNNKKLLDLWTQCVTESTDGTDESGSKQVVKTNRDKNSAESEDIKINKQLSQTPIKKVLLHENNSHLSIKAGEKAGEGNSYGNLGNPYHSLGLFQRAIQYHERHLKTAKEVGDKAGEGRSYCNLGNAYHSLGDFQRAILYHERHLEIAKKVGDKAGEGTSYGNLGNAYDSLGDFQRAIQYHERALKISKEVGAKAGEGDSYENLGNAYYSLGDFQRAIQYHERALKIAKEVGDKAGEGRSYCNLGNAYDSLGDFQRAIQYHERDLKISKEVGDKAGEGGKVGDKAGEGTSYCNLGNAYCRLGDFQRAIQYHERHLKIAKEVGDKAGEGKSYGNLGNAYRSLGDFQRAIQYHKRALKIAKEVGDKAGEGKSYCNLGNGYCSQGDFQKAIQYNERALKIAKEVGDKAGEGRSYCNLGNAYDSLGDFQRAIQYHERDLKIAKEVGDKAREGGSYGNLGNAYCSLGDFQRAIQYHERALKIAKEVGDKAGEGSSYFNLGRDVWSLGDLERAADFYHSCVVIFEAIRTSLRLNDDWKISYRDMQRNAYNCLWRLRLKQNQIFDALLSAEQGRAQALNDLICFRYGLGETQLRPHTPRISDLEVLIGDAVSNTVFMAIDNEECKIFYWFINSLQDIQLRSIEMSSYGSFKDVN